VAHSPGGAVRKGPEQAASKGRASRRERFMESILVRSRIHCELAIFSNA
jgi:hypothetical protein